MELSNVYPYLVPGLFNPDWERITIPVGHGIYATLFEDHRSEHGIVHATVSPDALDAAGLTPQAAHAAALENLERFASGEEAWGLSMKLIGRPGEPVNFLLISDHPRAAAGGVALAEGRPLTEALAAVAKKRASKGGPAADKG